MMKTFITAFLLALMTACAPAVAQKEQDKQLNPTGTPLYAKPVPCGGLPELIVEFKKTNMYPIMGLGGYSWQTNGMTNPSVTIIVVNENGRFAVVEKNAQDFCLLSTGNVIEYNSNTIKDVMDWN